MSIKVANSAGFCFGVDRAVTLVYELIKKGEKVCTLGPIIHNQQVVDDLNKQGVRIAQDPSEVEKDEILVIRSHGVSKAVYDQIKDLGINVKDATCPFVTKIHSIVKNASDEGKIVLIAGDPGHPEVVGIRGHCNGESYVFSTAEELEVLMENNDNFVQNDLIMVAQTTFQINSWENCAKVGKKLCTKLKIFDTICNATSERQKEAESLAKTSDLMVVVGGKHSSNTRKLYEVCCLQGEALLVQTADELRDIFASGKSDLLEVDFQKNSKGLHALGDLPKDTVGITAGASTPAQIIKEVHDTMSEIINNTNEENATEELSFAELFEQYEEQQAVYHVGKKIKGVVTSVSKNEVQVDIGGKQSGFIPSSELSNDSSVKPEDILKKGDELNLVVVKISDQDGMVTLSKKRFDAEKGYEEIIKAKDEDKTLTGKITDVVRGGALVLTGGLKVFIPISQLSDHRVENAEEFLGKEVNFKIIEVNPSRRRAVASVRRLLAEKRKVLADKFWEKVEIGETYTGRVKSLTDYGAFVDLGGVDGMIHITELSWTKIKHPSEIVKVGDEVEVYVKDVDEERRKISLGYRKQADNPWEVFKKDYDAGAVVKVKIVSITQFGAFAEIIPGVDGLIHISQIANQHISKVSDVLSVGQEVDAKITDVDYDKHRISLSMRALIEEEEAEEDDENTKAVADIEGVEVE